MSLNDSLAQMIYRQLTERLARLEDETDRVLPLVERAETSGGFPQSTLALAPTVSVRGGDCLFITDGRKSGEGVGAGTGVPAYWNSATTQWFRMSDDTAVVV